MRRRTFLEMSALATAGAMCPGLALGAGSTTWARAPCRLCSIGCRLDLALRDGKVVAIAGDRSDPISRGLLCARGYHAGLTLSGAGRLTQPLLRKGDAQEPVTWDAAIAVLARRLEANPSGFAVFGGGRWTEVEARASHALAARGGVGVDAPAGIAPPVGAPADLEACDVLLLWGGNAAEVFPVLFSKAANRRAAGEPTRLIQIGGRRTRTTAFCQEAWPLPPGAEAVVAGGLLRELLARKAIAGSQAEQARLLKTVAHFTPEFVQETVGLNGDDLERIADLFADEARRVVSLWSTRLGAGASAQIHALHAASGHLGRPGDAALGLHEALTDGIPLRTIGTEALWSAFAAKDGGVDTLWVHGADPALTLPDRTRLFDPSRGRDDRFLVVSDAYDSQTTRAADLVLPTTLWVERAAPGWPQLVTPPGQARDLLWQIVAVAGQSGSDALGKGVAAWPGFDGAAIAAALPPTPASAPVAPDPPTPERPDAEYPLWLVTGAVLEHGPSAGLTRHVPPLRRAMPAAYVEMHPDDARRLGIVDGQAVEVRSRRGAVVLPARLDDRGRPAVGEVFVPIFDPSVQVNALTLHGHGCAVRVRPTPT